MALISLQNIYKAYGNRKVLNNISLDINQGDMISIMGRSGSGKTTLLNILGLLDDKYNGSYIYNGKNVSDFNEKKYSIMRRDNIGFVVQNYALINQNDVYLNISLPLMCKNLRKKDIKLQVEQISERVGISDLLKKYPYELSGGECQRVAIARALIRKPDIILADEPTGALDISTERGILNIFQDLNKEGVTILLITHDSTVSKMCHKIYQLDETGLCIQ